MTWAIAASARTCGAIERTAVAISDTFAPASSRAQSYAAEHMRLARAQPTLADLLDCPCCHLGIRSSLAAWMKWSEVGGLVDPLSEDL